nr:NADH dehydrogenase subunit 6 [Carrikerella sp.]
MFQFEIILASSLLSINFLFLNHPLSMGMTLFIQAILICLISGSLSINFWFSYILLLIFLGGILVLFLYVTSIASNELFLFSYKLPLLFFMIFIFLSFYWPYNNFLSNIQDTLKFYSCLSYNSTYFLIKLYNQPINMITILTASYLFLSLIVVVKIINIYKGPLRQMNYAKTHSKKSSFN